MIKTLEMPNKDITIEFFEKINSRYTDSFNTKLKFINNIEVELLTLNLTKLDILKIIDNIYFHLSNDTDIYCWVLGDDTCDGYILRFISEYYNPLIADNRFKEILKIDKYINGSSTNILNFEIDVLQFMNVLYENYISDEK